MASIGATSKKKNLSTGTTDASSSPLFKNAYSEKRNQHNCCYISSLDTMWEGRRIVYYGQSTHSTESQDEEDESQEQA